MTTIGNVAIEVFVTLFTALKDFVNGLAIALLRPIWNFLSAKIPNFEWFLGDLMRMLNTFSDYVIYILDASLISKLMILYVISSAIFRITAKFTFFTVKILIKWWHYIAP